LRFATTIALKRGTRCRQRHISEMVQDRR